MLNKLADAISKSRFVVFDNDGVTYRITPEMMQACSHAAALATQKFVPGLSYENAKALCQGYYRKYHSSTYGLVIDYGVDHAEVHDIYHKLVDERHVPKDDVLPELFESFILPRALLTNGSRDWTNRVLNRLRLRAYFPDHSIYPFEDVDYQRKAASEKPFRHVLDREGFCASDSIMVEDTPGNLIHAKKIGMKTVLVSDETIGPFSQFDHIDFTVPNIRTFLRLMGNRSSIEHQAIPVQPSNSIK
ncbi:MAG: HAD hydrolase-like protein [Alphaproteobacteria bacterium]|nr:HAD hydrolase-like protein [Alphaproteobacteria bacterium]